MKDIGPFVAALFRHWKALLTSGLLAVALVVLPAWGVAIPTSAVQVAIVLCIVIAAFGAWKDQLRIAEQRASELAASKETIRRLTEEEGPALEVSDQEYWLLMLASRYGLRRQTIKADRHGAMANPLFIGETSIDYGDCRWLYSIVDGLIRRGAIKLEGGTIQIHRMTDEAKQAIRVGQKRGRKVQSPEEQLIDARSGSVVTLPP